MTSTRSTSRPYVDEDGKTDAERYLEGCLDGSIVACRKIQALAKRMLPEIRDGYRIWHWDLDAATRPVRFIEQFCRFTEGSKAGQPFIMEPYQRMIVELAFGFVDDDGLRRFQEVIVLQGRKNGKALALDTELPTPGGWRRMADVHVDDVVYGQDGRPSRVVAESEVFDKPTYLITFEDGAALKATGDHIWTVRGDGGPWRDMTTDEIADGFTPGSLEVPLCEPVRYHAKTTPCDPYAFGASILVDPRPIPAEYMMASVSQRRSLLAGIEGCMAHYGFDGVTLPSREVAEQVAELYSGLGMFARVSEVGSPGNRFYRVSADRARASKSIVSIERIPNEPTKCIAIDNDSHLYLAGRRYTATHNTQLCAALNIYMLMMSGEYGAQVYNAATTTEQASLCFGATQDMIEANDKLAKRIRRGRIPRRKVIGLNYDKTNSYLCTISSNAKHLDGLSTYFAVMDELGACRDHGAVYDQITESFGARQQPMLFIITTENEVRHNIWDERKDYATGWLEGKIHDDRLLPVMFELDDRAEIFKEEMWAKANPGLGTVKSAQFIRDRLNKAEQSPHRMPSLLMKDFNLVANQYTSFLSYEECYQDATYEFDASQFRYCVIGFDLAERNDLNAAVAMFKRPGDDTLYERAMFWMCEASLNLDDGTHKQRDDVPYQQWQADGLIRAEQGSKVDQKVVVEWIRELIGEGILPIAVAYDGWHVDAWTERELRGMVGDRAMREVKPWEKAISQAMKEHKIDLGDGMINDNDNDILHWCRANVQAKRDNADNVFPQKKDLRHDRRIDGYMAEIYAYIAYKEHEDEYLSIIGWHPPGGDV